MCILVEGSPVLGLVWTGSYISGIALLIIRYSMRICAIREMYSSSAIFFESPREDFSIDMADHWFILNNEEKNGF